MHFRRGNHGPGGDAYRCPGCNQLVNARTAEQTLEEVFLDELDTLPVIQKVESVTVAETELDEARQAYAQIAEFLPSAPDEQTRTTLFEQLKLVGDRITRLETQKKTPAGDQWETTDQTYGGVWRSLDTEGRRRMLISAGVKFKLLVVQPGTRWSPPILQTELVVPQDLAQALAELGP